MVSHVFLEILEPLHGNVGHLRYCDDLWCKLLRKAIIIRVNLGLLHWFFEKLWGYSQTRIRINKDHGHPWIFQDIHYRQLKHHYFCFFVWQMSWINGEGFPSGTKAFRAVRRAGGDSKSCGRWHLAESWVPGIPRVRGFRDGKNTLWWTNIAMENHHF